MKTIKVRTEVERLYGEPKSYQHIIEHHSFIAVEDDARKALLKLAHEMSREAMQKDERTRQSARAFISELWALADRVGTVSEQILAAAKGEPQKINGASVVNDYEGEDEDLGDRAQDGSIG